MSEAQDLARAVRAVRAVLGGEVLRQEKTETPPPAEEKHDEPTVEALFPDTGLRAPGRSKRSRRTTA